MLHAMATTHEAARIPGTTETGTVEGTITAGMMGAEMIEMLIVIRSVTTGAHVTKLGATPSQAVVVEAAAWIEAVVMFSGTGLVTDTVAVIGIK